MNMENENKDAIWPFAKFIVAGLIVFFVGVWAYTSFFKKEIDGFDYSKVLVEKKIHVYDHLNGAIKITDTSGKVLTIIENNGAFARVVFRTLAKERIMVGVGPEKPFILTARQNGILSISDPITNSNIDINAFGESNMKLFSELLAFNDTK